ncbi:MAG: ABC transporter permease, partial [Gammaproteobacteria bacterium]
MPFLLELAWRDLRQSGRSLWVFFACLVLGVTLVAATGGLHGLVRLGLLADTRALMGGDLEVDVSAPLPDQALAWISDNGTVSKVIELDTMLRSQGDEFIWVEMQAADAHYPLYGQLTFSPALSLEQVTAFDGEHWGAAIDPVLAETHGIQVGDRIGVGKLAL